jgi:hypothetical protein
MFHTRGLIIVLFGDDVRPLFLQSTMRCELLSQGHGLSIVDRIREFQMILKEASA